MKKIRGKEVVREHINFGETLNNEDLSSLRSPFTKPINDMLSPISTVIVDYKLSKEKYALITIISNNLDNSKNFIDHKSLRKEYETKSYTEAFKNSLGVFFNNEINEANFPNAPDHPQVRQDFIKYQKKLRASKQEMARMISQNEFIPLDFSFGNVDDIRMLTETQEVQRTKMLKLKDEEPEKFNLLWSSGEYHLATLVARLEQTTYPETLMMREEILKRNNITIEVKDFGLTTSEMMNGLQVANKTNEKYLYKAFVEGNINLKAMILIIRNNNLIDENDRFLALKTMQLLSNDPDMRHAATDADKYLQVRRLIKKYGLPVHNNWKKD